MNTGLPTGDGSVERLFLIPATPGVLYAKTGKQVYKSTDGGDSWSLKATLPGACSGFAINLGAPAYMYCAVDKTESGEGGRVHSSTDEGGTWTSGAYIERLEGYTTSTYPYWFTSLATPAAEPSTVYAIVGSSWITCEWSDGGVTRWVDSVFRSSNRGSTFTPLLGPNTGRLALDPARQGSVYIYPTLQVNCAAPGGPPVFPKKYDLYRSDNGTLYTGVNLPHGPEAQQTGSPTGSEMAFAGSAVYAGCPGSGLCRSTDGGGDWARIDGTTRFTLAKPGGPLAITLAPGERGARDFSVAFVEARTWKAGVRVTVSGGTWLSTSTDEATTPFTLTAKVNAAGLEFGDYQGEVRLSSAHAAADVVIPVRLSVIDAPAAGPRYTITRFAGTGKAGNSGDGGPAREAQLNNPAGIWLAADGSLYVADRSNHQVRKISPDGVIATVAGSGKKGTGGDGGSATKAELDTPQAVMLDGGGNLYISEWGSDRVRKVDPQGVISTFVSNIYGPGGMAMGKDGDILMAEITQVLQVTPAGVVRGVTASGALKYPADLVLDADGNMIVADTGGYIRKVTGSGAVTNIAGTGTSGYTGDGPAAQAALSGPRGWGRMRRATSSSPTPGTTACV